MLSSVVCLALLDFFTLSHKQQNFFLRGGGHKMCVLVYQILSEMFIILRRNERDMIIYVYWSSSEVPDILERLQINLNFLNRVPKISQISNYTKIRTVEVELFHADGQT
jgi:hypothetical protein